MLLAYDNHVWCVIQERSTGKLQLATIQQNQILPMTNIDGLIDGYLPDNFPISDFAATEFKSSSERPRAMIVGGRSTNGDPINTRWNLERLITSDEYRLKDFTISQPTFHTLTGAQFGMVLLYLLPGSSDRFKAGEASTMKVQKEEGNGHLFQINSFLFCGHRQNLQI
jgi:hypothetical protein